MSSSNTLTFQGTYINSQVVFNKLSAVNNGATILVLNVPLTKETFEQNCQDADNQVTLYCAKLDMTDPHKQGWAELAALYKACYEVLNAAVNNAVTAVSNFSVDGLNVQPAEVSMEVLTNARSSYFNQYLSALSKLQSGFCFPVAKLASQTPRADK